MKFDHNGVINLKKNNKIVVTPSSYYDKYGAIHIQDPTRSAILSLSEKQSAYISLEHIQNIDIKAKTNTNDEYFVTFDLILKDAIKRNYYFKDDSYILGIDLRIAIGKKIGKIFSKLADISTDTTYLEALCDLFDIPKTVSKNLQIIKNTEGLLLHHSDSKSLHFYSNMDNKSIYKLLNHKFTIVAYSDNIGAMIKLKRILSSIYEQKTIKKRDLIDIIIIGNKY